MQIERAPHIRLPRIGGQHDRERIEMPVDDRIGRKNWSLNFEKAAIRKEISRSGQQLRPQPQTIPIRRREKIRALVGIVNRRN